MTTDLSLEHQVALLSDAEQEAILADLDMDTLEYDWNWTGRPSQIFPVGSDADPQLILALAGRGWGKLLAVTTILPTPSGWVTLSDVKVGDTLFDELGRPTKVLATYDSTPERAYRLTFSDGTELVAGGEHQWVTWTHQERKQYLRTTLPHPLAFPENWADRAIRTTDQLAETVRFGKRGDLNHCIPVTAPLVLPEADLLIDPWALGFWLGDGSSAGGAITVHPTDDQEIRKQYEVAGYLSGKNHAVANRTPTFSIYGLSPQLRALGLLNKKHVPQQYLRGSVSQRQGLLAGLLDSDGYVDPVSSVIEFCSTLECLADAVLELARSLGERPVKIKGRATSGGIDFGPKWRIKWRSSFNPFRLSRKAAVWRFPAAQALRTRHRMITAIDAVPVSAMRCLTVDSPNSMYLVGEGMIPTHNTRAGAQWMRTLDDMWPVLGRDSGHMRFALLGRTSADVRDVMLEGPSGLLNIYPPSLRDRMVWTPSRRRLEMPNGAVGIAFSAEEPDQLRGPQFHIGWCLAEGTQVRTAGGELPIEAIEVGDRVWTRAGLRPVLASGMTGIKSVMVITLDDGTVLRPTREHHIYTQRGWVQAQNVVLSDTLYAWTNRLLDLLPSTSGRASSGTEMQRMGTTETPVGVCCSTSPSGSRFTDEYQKATTSITSIMTEATTLPPTSLQSQRAIIESTTRVIESRTSQLGQLRSNLRQHEHVPTGCGPTGSHVPLLVNGAALFSAPSECGPDSAIQSVLQPRDVVSVEHSSSLVRTYDLTVDGQSEYFANGILVHNSDETASYKQIRAGSDNATAWENLRIAVRLGTLPQILATTTPKRVPLLKQILAEAQDHPEKILIRRGRTLDNVKLSSGYLDTLLGLYGGTQLGKQELDGEMLDDVVGAMTSVQIIDQYRVTGVPLGIPWIKIVGVDPSVAEKPHDECGIVVVYISNTYPVLRRHAFVVDDLSLRASPTVWGDIVVKAAHEHGAIVVAETNQGAALVKQMVKQSAAAAGLQNPPIREVWASKSKAVRSEPVGGAYSRGRVHHVNVLPELEDVLTSWVPGESGYSPDRMDALVHACASGLFPEALIHGAPGTATLHSVANQRIPLTRQTNLPARRGAM